MVHDDAKVGNRIGQQYVGLHQIHAGIRCVQRKVSLSQQLQIGDLVGIENDLAVVRAVETAGSDRRDRAGPCESAPHIGRSPAARIEISRDADHDRVGPARFEIPEIVVDPLARFDHDRAHDAGWLAKGLYIDGSDVLEIARYAGEPMYPAPSERVPSNK